MNPRPCALVLAAAAALSACASLPAQTLTIVNQSPTPCLLLPSSREKHRNMGTITFYDNRKGYEVLSSDATSLSRATIQKIPLDAGGELKVTLGMLGSLSPVASFRIADDSGNEVEISATQRRGRVTLGTDKWVPGLEMNLDPMRITIHSLQAK